MPEQQTSPTPLTVTEASAILRVDEILEAMFEARSREGLVLDTIEVREAWVHLVASARDRVAAFGKSPR